MHRSIANSLLLLAGLVWGLGFVAQASAMDDIGPFQFVAFRFILATIIVAPFAFMEGRKERARGIAQLHTRDWSAMVTLGLVFFAMMILQQIGLLATSVTNAGMLTGLYVIFTPILALMLWKQAQPIFLWPAALLAFFGIWLLGGGGMSNFTWGDAVVIAAALLAAFQVILVGTIGMRIGRPVLIACAQFAVTGIVAFVGFLLVRGFDWSYEPAFSVATLIAAGPEILYAAAFAGGLAFTLQAIAQRHTGSGDAAILLSSEALFAALGGAILLGERLDWLGYLGCLCLFTAIVAVSWLSAKAEEKQLAAKT
ncbi:DMT family transporter [Pseudahrensia aquimaris]|uniref:DMT family transporter n=1 Tax=Pseudahrensia aquimaris TaxID=744461 RepID=A0ABW3FJQ4_9HYPH